MKVALYARVSKDKADSDGKMQDPNNQLIPMREFCQRMEWEISNEFVDRASGGDSNRPQFQAMMGKVRQRHFDIILVWALDRFSREGIVNTFAYVKQLRDYKTILKGYNQDWLDTSREGANDIILGIHAHYAQEELKKISDRTKAGLAKLEKQGIKGGRHRKDCQCKIHARKRGGQKTDTFVEGVILED